MMFETSGLYNSPLASLAVPMYLQPSSELLRIHGLAGVSQILSPANAQLLPFTNSPAKTVGIELGFVMQSSEFPLPKV